jgi:opacity protein-like surface antigen
VTSSASVAIHDIVTARARAGWTFDRFLPYGFAGVAVGRADVSRFATLGNSTETFIQTGPPQVINPPVCLCLPRDPQSQAQGGFAAYGFTVGLGMDVAVLNNVFVRGEWEFIEFPNVSDMRVSANSVRAAVGLKF